MSARMWVTDARSTGRGLCYLDYSFVTNGTGQPTITYATSLSDTMGLARGEGVSSVTRSAAGIFLVTLTDGFRGHVAKACDLEDYASGSDDGSYATFGPISNEGLGNPSTVALTFNLFTRLAAGTKTDFGPGGTGAARRLSFQMVLKESMEGK